METIKHLVPDELQNTYKQCYLAKVSKKAARQAAYQAREHLEAIDAEESKVILGQAARRWSKD